MISLSHIEMINKALEGYMPESDDIVSRAMRYSVENGGKRIRPELVMSFCEACGGDSEKGRGACQGGKGRCGG